MQHKDKSKNYKSSYNKILNNIIDENYSFFNQEINDKYLDSQNYFCDNQNQLYNKIFEDKILLIDIKYKDKIYNMFVYKKLDVVSRHLINYKVWEPVETNNLINALDFFSNKKKIKNSDIYIIDIGANIGWYSFLLGKYGYKIISFEPSKINNYILKKTFCLNRELNLTIINKGLHIEDKKCVLFNSGRNEGNGHIYCNKSQIVLNSSLKSREIILTKLSNYLPFFNKNKNLALIKLDVEGSEGKVIEGGIELITKFHVPFIFLEFTPSYLKKYGTEPKQLLQLFADNGYKISTLNFFNNFISVDDIIRKNYLQINLYIVHSSILK